MKHLSYFKTRLTCYLFRPMLGPFTRQMVFAKLPQDVLLQYTLTQLISILIVGCAGIEVANLFADIVSSFGRRYMRCRKISLKHSREDEQDDERSCSRKRARLWRSGLTWNKSVDSTMLGWSGPGKLPPNSVRKDYVRNNFVALGDSSYAPSAGSSEDEDGCPYDPRRGLGVFDISKNPDRVMTMYRTILVKPRSSFLAGPPL